MKLQQTIQNPVSLEGRGLFHGQPATLTFKPAPAENGIVFVRSDLDNAHIPALVQNVVKRKRRTTIKKGDASVDTCEHCMSAVAASGIDNLFIELTGPEVPAMDGSAQPFFNALQKAGLKQQDKPKKTLVITKPVMVRQNGSMAAAVPSDHSHMELLYELDYGNSSSGPLARQLQTFELPGGDYAKQIAPSRTFILEQEAAALQKSGIGQHLTEDDILVLGENGPIGTNQLRFDNEPVRHKMLDLIGDLYLLGCAIEGKITAYRSGHSLNHQLVRELIKQHRGQHLSNLAIHNKEIDIRKLFRMMPHRYPMLLVDRVLEIDGQRRAVGIKNVTINEPFFQGHYPTAPIMPGVLIVEAMAQLSGVLIGRNLEHTGKLPVLLSLDRVKLRKAVTPGDQLMLEAESVRVRSRIAHMRCRSYVGEDLAAEAEIKFMLVDEDS